ncbi:MAG: chemotaxis protein CheB [Mariprofundaceae bacterium]
MKTLKCVVIGSSAGGIKALCKLLPLLPESIPFPICIVQHLKAGVRHYLTDILSNDCKVPVQEAEDDIPLKSGHIYLAPADYHLLIENKTCLRLSVDEPEHHCRPSIDVLFESAADVFGSHTLGIILTGMGSDGAKGLQAIANTGGRCLIQNLNEAEFPDMPKAALKTVPHAKTLLLDDFYAYIALESG